MPRFFDPSRYNEDWYIDMKGEYQKFFDYIIETCDNAGVWKPNKFDFETKTGFKVNLGSLLEKANKGKERILVLENGRWFMPGFIQFQWFNKISVFNLSTGNPRHVNILNSLTTNGIPYSKVRGLAEVCQRSKDKDKDIGGIKEIGGVGEKTIRGEVVFNVESLLLTNPIQMERICMAAKVDLPLARESLRDYHLWLQSKEQYPKPPPALFAGFEKWLRNEKKFNGKHGQSPAKGAAKPGTSEARNRAASEF